MKNKKIFFILPNLGPGGAERVISNLANGFIPKYDIHIITLNRSEVFYDLNKKIKVSFCNGYPSESKNLFEALKLNYLFIRKLLFYLKQEKPDIVISFITSANILSIMTTRLMKIPCIISERNYPNTKKIKKIRKVLTKWLYKRANFLVVQTSEIKNYFSLIMPKEKIIILPNPISYELTIMRDTNDQKENFVLNVGSLTNQKSQDLLIKAFANIDNDNWKLIIIGEGEKRAEYETLIKSLKLDDKIILKGLAKDISFYYNKSKIFAFTSIYEGFPNALIEAMHFGLPCISTDCPTGPSQLIQNGINGYLININDQQKLEYHLTKLMSDKNLRYSLGNNAMATTKKFEINSVLLQWGSIIEKIIKK